MTTTTDLGAFPVAAGADEVLAFRRATGCAGDHGALPLTFPMRWLALPEVRGALLALIPERDIVPVHESQSFDYMRPLAVDASYTLTLAGRRVAAPDRLIVDGVVLGPDNAVHVQVETILRLVSTRAVAA